MLLTGNVRDWYAAFRHVLRSCGLQASADSCAEFVLHLLRNIHPVQLLVQKTGHTGVADDAGRGTQYSLKLSVMDLGTPARRMMLQ